MVTVITESGTFLKKSGKAPAKEVVERISKNADGSTGSARIVDGDFHIYRKAEGLNPEAFLKVMGTTHLGEQFIVHCSKRKPPDDELQPTTIFEEGDSEIILAFHDGEVDLDKFQEIFDETLKKHDGDLQKCLQVLDGPSLRSRISSECWKNW